jgi:hypothetical protein
MSKPPKVRSFIDHWPGPNDMRRNHPLAVAYISHHAQPGDMLRDVKRAPISYTDHFAHPGDTKRI